MCQSSSLRVERSTQGLPSYSWPKAKRTWASPYFNREAPNLLAVREGVTRAIAGLADFELLCVGDSKTYAGSLRPNAGVLAWPMQMRRVLGAAEGFAQASDPVDDDRWTTGGMVKAAGASRIPSRIGLMPTGQGPYFTGFVPSDPHTGAIWHVRAPHGAQVTLTVDGENTTHILDPADQWQQVRTGPLPDSTHSMTVASADSVDVLGVTLQYPTSRLKVSRAARGGAAAVDWLPGAPQGHWHSVIEGPATTPDAIIINLGTNLTSDVDSLVAFYEASVSTGVPIIGVVPGMLGGHQAHEVYEPMMSKLYELADRLDVAGPDVVYRTDGMSEEEEQALCAA